ncbi:hypothetical protein EVAR_11428_1 [Eumeta japonica]|uniref:Uncharacterized protein n=1 Tax=Eumeta variegata TaxID=151549 RepID=A0A4C1TNE2_EUMVA|nr:hypothetical protein EVAR_11428_1 [Eumeta japonica]
MEIPRLPYSRARTLSARKNDDEFARRPPCTASSPSLVKILSRLDPRSPTRFVTAAPCPAYCDNYVNCRYCYNKMSELTRRNYSAPAPPRSDPGRVASRRPVT